MARLRAMLLCALLSGSTVLSYDVGNIRNANHIFNTVHSSMRQWGSSLRHNGMSFFLATVPAGTQLYHGRTEDQDEIGVEWLAFEPEHALCFARGWPNQPPHDHSQIPLDANAEHSPYHMSKGTEEQYGWLATYRTKRDLRFLYIDGTSAGKSDKGTLDSTDYLLLNRTGSARWWWDRPRAIALCDLARKDWDSRIAGFIRMEAGFEIIMCSFRDSLDLVRRMPVPGSQFFDRRLDQAQRFAFFRSYSSRFHGIGGDRVSIDYNSLITANKYLDVPAANEEHRLVNVSSSLLDQLRNEVTKKVLEADSQRSGNDINWQVVADMIVTKYSDWLNYLLNPEISYSKDRFEVELDVMLQPFSNATSRNASEEAHRCLLAYLPYKSPGSSYKPANASIAEQAVTSITHHICSVLADTLHDNEASLSQKIGNIKDLLHYLDWTTFKECRGCDYDEVCAIAAWPYGTAEDHYHPSCKNISRIFSDDSYWRDDEYQSVNTRERSVIGRFWKHGFADR